MKRTIIFSAFIAIVLLSGILHAQPVSSVRVTFSEAIGSNGSHTTTMSYTGLESPSVRVFEALLPVPVADCFESSDFSSARLIRSERVGLVYDGATDEYQFSWTVTRDNRDTCRVLIVTSGQVDAADYVIWRKSLGAVVERSGDGSVRSVSYSISLNTFNSHPVKLRVENPGQTDDVIEAQFPAAPDNNFQFFEAVFPASSEAQCLANNDFANATPVGTDRAFGVFDPTTSTFFLRNSNSAARPAEPCHVLLVGQAASQAGYNLWRTNFGRTAFASEDESSIEQSDGGRPRRTTVTSYVLQPRVGAQ